MEIDLAYESHPPGVSPALLKYSPPCRQIGNDDWSEIYREARREVGRVERFSYTSSGPRMPAEIMIDTGIGATDAGAGPRVSDR